MRKHTRSAAIILFVLMLAVVLITVLNGLPSRSGAEEPRMIPCPVCQGNKICTECLGGDPSCPDCQGTNLCAACGGEGQIAPPSRFFNTALSLLPPVLAIALALITKEVYSSLFIGILAGGLLYANFSPEGTVRHVLQGGFLTALADSYNVGILIFLVILGAMVYLINKSGGSAAFGRWAQTHIKSRVGAQLVTIALGCFIFIDDYFNCLTVGSVMRPITDKHQVSRAKLAYIIDSTAAPVCIIAPISSWAAAVAAFAEDGQGLNLFIQAIPYNFYALLTIVMLVGMVVTGTEYGKMAKFEKNAVNGDIFSGKQPYASMDEETGNPAGKVWDLVLPILVLIVSCVVGMIYSGDFFTQGSDTYHNFVTALSASDASVGLVMGSGFALIFTMVYFLLRRTIPFRAIMESVPEGFKAMVPAILILTFAWTLKAMTDSLGAKFFVRDVVQSSAAGMQFLLPALVFVVGCLLAFATGTSWGTFGMLIPIVQGVFSMDNPLAIVCIAACMSGAVCGDHCSPISDTTIMASAGAQSDHVDHVDTQLPYAITAALVSLAGYLLTGIFVQFALSPIWALPIALGLMIAVIFFFRARTARKANA